jgi:hypothetical protein
MKDIHRLPVPELIEGEDYTIVRNCYSSDPDLSQIGAVQIRLPAGLSAVVTISVPTIAAAAGTESATSKATIHLRTSFVDDHGPSTKLCAVQRSNCFFCFASVRHFDEPEASGSARITISHNPDTFNNSVTSRDRTESSVAPKLRFPTNIFFILSF